jgi:hypothetical protein
MEHLIQKLYSYCEGNLRHDLRERVEAGERVVKYNTGDFDAVLVTNVMNNRYLPEWIRAEHRNKNEVVFKVNR